MFLCISVCFPRLLVFIRIGIIFRCLSVFFAPVRVEKGVVFHQDPTFHCISVSSLCLLVSTSLVVFISVNNVFMCFSEFSMSFGVHKFYVFITAPVMCRYLRLFFVSASWLFLSGSFSFLGALMCSTSGLLMSVSVVSSSGIVTTVSRYHLRCSKRVCSELFPTFPNRNFSC